MDILIKRHIRGTIKPRWAKPKVVKWLEWGAVPAIVGLWLPNWLDGYSQLLSQGEYIQKHSFAFPPIVSYIGALILFKACTEGIKDMGYHYKGAVVSSLIAIIFAALSFVFHFLIGLNTELFGALTIATIGLAAFFSATVFWFTLGKVAEIADETRAHITKRAILITNIAALTSGVASVILIYIQNLNFILALRITVVLFTITFLLCRYGVYCYKTQKSIGATTPVETDEQFWI